LSYINQHQILYHIDENSGEKDTILKALSLIAEF